VFLLLSFSTLLISSNAVCNDIANCETCVDVAVCTACSTGGLNYALNADGSACAECATSGGEFFESAT
jgi:hypothetical protein